MKHDDPSLQNYLDRYANWKQLKTVAITFDVDWAPDYMIRNALDIVERHDLRATFFATHDSQLLREVALKDRHEVGLHPNLSANSTQGQGIHEIITNLRTHYPKAHGNRFHILGMSYRDLLWLGGQSVQYDVSRILFNAPYLLPVWTDDLKMVLLPYMWEDGVCENQGLTPSLGTIALKSPGLKIINFHPMNVFINCANRTDRLAFQRANSDLLNTSEKEAKVFRRKGFGSGKTLENLCQYIAEQGIEAVCVHELVKSFPRKIYGIS